MAATASVRSPDYRPNIKADHPRFAQLPREAQQKFEKLRQLEARCAALRNGLLDQQEKARDDIGDELRALAMFDRQAEPEGKFVYETDETTGARKRVPAVFPEREKILQRIEALKDEIVRQAAEIAEAATGFTTESILTWLDGDVSADTRFRMVPAPKFVIPRGSSLADALMSNRAEQALIKERLADLANASITRAEAKARVRDEIAALAERGRPDLSNFLFGHPIAWPTEMLVVSGHGAHPHTSAATVTDVFGLLIWATKDVLLKKLDAEIESMGDDATAIPAADRPALIAEAKVQLLTLQHTEEAIICRMIESGHFVTRTCTDPRVLLGVDDGALAGR